MKALLILLFLSLLGCVSQARYDQSQTRIAELQTSLHDSEADLRKAKSTIDELQAHKYQLVEAGGRTWRFDTVTGDSCIKLTTASDWKINSTKRQSCECKDVIADILSRIEKVGNLTEMDKYFRKQSCGF
jgi:outer membrane murein-binding lipoprotein Lpp